MLYILKNLKLNTQWIPVDMLHIQVSVFYLRSYCPTLNYLIFLMFDLRWFVYLDLCFTFHDLLFFLCHRLNDHYVERLTIAIMSC
jgi:hypothetical protein